MTVVCTPEGEARAQDQINTWYLNAIAAALTARDAEAEGLRAERDAAYKALMSLTPGGSEFHHDPDRCVRFVKDTRESMDRITKDAIYARRAAEKEAEGLREAVKVLREVEWIRTYEEESIKSVELCPFCFNDKRNGHTPACRLIAALDAAGGA
jgi:hypothetical protein